MRARKLKHALIFTQCLPKVIAGCDINITKTPRNFWYSCRFFIFRKHKVCSTFYPFQSGRNDSTRNGHDSHRGWYTTNPASPKWKCWTMYPSLWQATSLHMWNKQGFYRKFLDSLLVSHWKWSYLNTDMGKFESSQKDESRAQSAHSAKSFRKPRTFNCHCSNLHTNVAQSRTVTDIVCFATSHWYVSQQKPFAILLTHAKTILRSYL